MRESKGKKPCISATRSCGSIRADANHRLTLRRNDSQQMPYELIANYIFYRKNKDILHKKYIDKFIIIHGKNVVGEYDKAEDALSNAMKEYEIGTF